MAMDDGAHRADFEADLHARRQQLLQGAGRHGAVAIGSHGHHAGSGAGLHPQFIVGLKDSAGDLAYSRAAAKSNPGFDVFPSSEASLGQANADGFAGCISATTNLTAPHAQAAWVGQGTEAGAAAVRKAGDLRAIIAKYPLISSVKSALATTYRDEAWARVALPLQPLNAEQAGALAAAIAERLARA